MELEQHDVALWDIIADSLITWCKRGVDGFRCDAGYKIPTPAWEYIMVRAQDEFPEAIFLLEGSSGPWKDTERLLTEGGMQWGPTPSCSRIIPARTSPRISTTPTAKNERVGSYVNYSETHDNKLAGGTQGRTWFR